MDVERIGQRWPVHAITIMIETLFSRQLKMSLFGASVALIALGGSASRAWAAGSDSVVPVNADAKKTRKVQAPAGLVTPFPQLIVTLRDGVNPELFASYYGLRVQTRLSHPNEFALNAASNPIARQTLAFLVKDSAVVDAYQNAFVKRVRSGFVPNDPYYTYNNPAGFPGQWHLYNSNNLGGVNIDARVKAAWDLNFTGSGVKIGICDDGLQTTHPDLSPNYNSADSYDFGQNDGVPDPVSVDDNHGTSVAGVAAAKGGNSLGVTGAAPNASVSGLRMNFDALTLNMLYDVIDYHSNAANSNIKVKNHSYGATDTYDASPGEKTRLATSASFGTIHTWAAGNARGTYTQDANKQEPQNSPDAITVAALSSAGKYASYSSFGANVFVTTPSSSNGGYAITTTDRTGADGYNGSESFTDRNYTTTFGGTSSASPLAAGVLALVKQAQPNLNTRFAKHLLVISSDVVDASDATPESDGGWKTNAAGNKFNQNYGFGLINAGKLVANAALYTGVTALETKTTGTVAVNANLADRTSAGDGVLTRTFTVGSSTKLEDILVNLNMTHPAIGDVEAFLVSPSGTRSRLMYRSGSDYHSDLDWTFDTNAFWGENPKGTWTIEVRDVLAGDAGKWVSYSVTTRHGALVPVSGGGTGDQAQFVSQSVATSIYCNNIYNASVTLKNTGSTTWDATNYRLGAMNPLFNNTWGRTHVKLNTGETVAPGATKTFTFTITAPATVGTFNFIWQMRKTSAPAASFGDVTPNVAITTKTGENATFVSQTVSTTMNSNVYYTCNVTVKNAGSTTWDATNYRLASINPTSNTRWGISHVKLLAGETVAPGATKSFTFQVKAPATLGANDFQWQMRKTSAPVGNFGESTPNVSVNVVLGDQAQFISQSVPSTMSKGVTYTVSISLKNTGTTTWDDVNYRLMSQNLLGNNIWGKTNVKLAPGETVAVGATKVFTFTVKAPAVAGTYNFQWQMRKTSVPIASFGDPSTNVAVVVN